MGSLARYGDSMVVPSKDQQLAKRKKRWAPRVRTGCWTCRSRRVKCDEARPFCMRCRSGGRRCAGFLDSVGPSLRLGAAPVASCPEERRLNRYFLDQLHSAVADEFNGEYWRYHVPRFVMTAPAVWHATNALSALMWARNDIRGDPATADRAKLNKLTVIQHSASLKHVLQLTRRENLSVGDKAVIIVANFFFCAIAGHPGNIETFMALHKKTVLLLRHWQFWEYVDSSTESMHLLYLFIKSVRICEESLLLTSQPPDDDWQEALASLQNRAPGSAIKAYIELEMLWIGLYTVLDKFLAQPSASTIDVAAVDMRRTTLQSRFTLWAERYQLLMHFNRNIHPLAAAALRVRCILTRISFKMRLLPFEHVADETCWDPFDDDFTSAWSIIQEVLATAESQNTSAQVRFRPSLRTYLQFIARYCRKHDLRHAAAALLRAEISIGLCGKPPKTPLLIESIIALEEGQWDSCRQAPKCERGVFVCNWHRVAKVHAASLRESEYHEFQCRTVGDVVCGNAGTTFRLTASLWA